MENVISRGDKVVDSEGEIGVVLNADDPHNIEVEYMSRGCKTGGTGLYCIVPECEKYSGLFVYKYGGRFA